MSGRVEAIWSKRSHGGVMDPARDVIAVEGKGLEGDANFGATRQVTVIEKEVFDRILAELPGADPAMRRANIMVSGIRLPRPVSSPTVERPVERRTDPAQRNSVAFMTA